MCIYEVEGETGIYGSWEKVGAEGRGKRERVVRERLNVCTITRACELKLANTNIPELNHIKDPNYSWRVVTHYSSIQNHHLTIILRIPQSKTIPTKPVHNTTDSPTTLSPSKPWAEYRTLLEHQNCLPLNLSSFLE